MHTIPSTSHLKRIRRKIIRDLATVETSCQIRPKESRKYFACPKWKDFPNSWNLQYIINRIKKLKAPSQKKLASERNKLLRTIIQVTEVPLMILGFIWLGLVILELLNKSNYSLQNLGVVIWIIFVLDFILKFIISVQKVTFLKKNVLTIISLIVPALRLLRIIRFLRLLRLTKGLRLIKMVTGFNRGMKSLAFTMKKRAFGYVLLLSLFVVFIGAAGLYGYEKDINAGFKNYSSALWWTAMLVMSMGTENWPVTPEGRILTFMIGLYGLAVFGYITATIASLFIGSDIGVKTAETSGSKQIEELKEEIVKLHKEILELRKPDEKL